MTSRKWQLAAGLTGLALFASIGVGVAPAMAADIPAGTDQLTITAGQGSTLAGKNLTVYRIAEYPDVVMNGTDLASLSAPFGEQHHRTVGEGRIGRAACDRQSR